MAGGRHRGDPGEAFRHADRDPPSTSGAVVAVLMVLVVVTCWALALGWDARTASEQIRVRYQSDYTDTSDRDRRLSELEQRTDKQQSQIDRLRARVTELEQNTYETSGS